MLAEQKLRIALRDAAPVGQHMSANQLTWREQAICKVLDGIITMFILFFPFIVMQAIIELMGRK